MTCSKWVNRISAAMTLVIASCNAWASSDLVAEVQGFLYAGQTREAVAAAQSRLTEAPDDDQARFALGAVQFLQAVEHLAQALHRYGLRSTYKEPSGLLGLPLLRIPVPENPNPEEVTYEALRVVLRTFVRDLKAAEDTLSEIKTIDIGLSLNVGLIRLDLNADGVASDDEALWQIFKQVADFPWLNEEQATKLLTDFDGSDIPWLQAYCHLLMAIAEFPLAYDWQDAFDATFQSVFPKAKLRSNALAARQAEILSELEIFEELLEVPERNPAESWESYQLRLRDWSKIWDESERFERMIELSSQLENS